MRTAEVTTRQTLYDLLSLRSENGVGRVRELAALRIGQTDADHATALGLKVSQWNLESFAGELEKALKPDLFELLAKGWSLFREVRKGVEKSAGPPCGSHAVPLLRHELEVKLEPRLVLSVQGVDWSDVVLGVSLKARFESARLTFVNGALAALDLGEVTGSLTLSVEHVVVGDFKRSLEMKARYDFHPSLHWPGDRASPAEEQRPSGYPQAADAPRVAAVARPS